MKLAVYTIGSPEVPSTRFRVMQYLPLLEKAGIHVKVFTLPAAGSGRISGLFGTFLQAVARFFQILKAPAYDKILVQKGLTPWRAKGFAGLLMAQGKPFILDMDDAVYLENPVTLPGFLRELQDNQEPLKLIQNAAHVIAGNSCLAEFISKHNAACTLIPSVIDTDRYPFREKPSRPPIVIGWSGSASTNFYVNEIIPVLNRLAEKYAFDFWVMSSDLRNLQTEKIKGYGFRFFKWSDTAEIEYLSRLDIGVMPLQDSPWARGKCGVKALQYMAVGVAAVCSPVGVNREIIQEGINGFLAADPEAWYQKLQRLIEGAALREKMGREARTTVEEKYSVRACFPALRAVIENGIS